MRKIITNTNLAPPADNELVLRAVRWLEKNTNFRCECVAYDSWVVTPFDVEGISTGWGVITFAEAKGFIALVVK